MEIFSVNVERLDIATVNVGSTPIIFLIFFSIKFGYFKNYLYLCIVNIVGCNGNTRVFGTLIPSSNLGVPTILITMIIEERTKKATKLLLRFLKQKNLLVEFKKDFNPNVKLKSLNIICYDEHISLEELIQIRLNRCKFSKSYILESLIDKILYFRAAKYKDWSKIDDEWRKFYRINKTFLN